MRLVRFAALIIPFSLACALLFFVFYRDAKDTAITELRHEQAIHARLAAQGIEDFFASWSRSLSALSATPGVVEANDTGRHSLLVFFEAHREQIRSITRVDAEGTILITYPSTSSEGHNISSQKHVRDILRSHKPVVSDVFHAVQGYDAIALHVPVFEGSAFRGSLAVVVNFESLAKRYFDVIRIGQTGYAWVVSRDGTLLYTPASQLTGKPALEVFKDSPSIVAMISKMLAGREGATTYSIAGRTGGRVVPMRYYALYAPIRLGNTFWSLVVTYPEKDLLAGLNSFRNRLALVVGLVFAGGMLLSIFVVKAWLTVSEREKRRHAEEAVRLSERLRATMYDVAPDVLYYLGVESGGRYRFLTVNPEFLKVTGLNESDVVGRTVDEVIPPASLAIVLERYGRAISSRTTVKWEEISAYPAGMKHGEVSITPIFDEGGTCTHLFGTVHDVTALRSTELRYRMLFQNGPQPVLVVDDETDQIVAANDAALRQFDYDDVELPAKSAQLISDVDKERVALARRQSPPIRRYSDLRFRRRDGSEFLADVASAAIEYDGRPSRLVVVTDVTERASAKRELQDAKQFNEEIISSAGEGIVAFDRDLRVLVWNRFMEQQTGTPAGEIVGKTMDAVLPLLHTHLVPGLRSTLETGERQTVEFSVELLGEQRWLRQVAVAHRTQAGTMLGVIAIISDITAQKRTEASLRASEQLHRSIIAATPNFVFTFDLDGRCTSANSALCKAVGLSQEELIGRHPRDVGVVPDQPEQWKAIYDQAVKDRKPVEFLTTFTLPDGRRVTHEGTFSPLFDEEGNVTTISAMTLDVTERLRATEMLNRLSQAVAQAAEVIFMTDREGRITYANPAFESVYGYSQEETLGKTPRLLKSGRYSNAEYERFWKNILAGKTEQGELVNKRRDGTLVTVERSVSPVFNEEGEVIGFLCVQADISERKRMEAEQEEIRARMVQLGKMEAIGTLAGGIAHDFNNILSVILSFTTVVERSRSNEQTFVKALQTIRQSVRRGADLARQVLTFARRTETTPGAVNVNDAVTEIARMLRATFPRTIVFDLALAENLPLVIADATQLHQALMNLFINARDAMPVGGTIRVSTRVVSAMEVLRRFPEARDASYVSIEVKDTGTGMSEEVRRRVFEPFFTTKGEGRGTGLGLAVTYGTVRAAGGLISVQSEQDRGTVFDIFLPIPEIMSAATASTSEGARVLDGTETILFVEDEPDIGPLMVENLRRHGYTAFLARDGQEALDLFERERIDLVVSDDSLPRLAGRDLLLSLRDRGRSVPFVLASGFVEPDVLDKLRRAGMHQFLQKPYRTDELLTVIRSALSASQVRRPTPAM